MATDDPVSKPYDGHLEEFMRQWSAVVSDQDRLRAMAVVNAFNRLPPASRRVAAAMIEKIERIARPELVP